MANLKSKTNFSNLFSHKEMAVWAFRVLGCVVVMMEINRRLNSGNACYRSVQNLVTSRLLSKNIKFRIYKTIILHVVLYGCETWSLKLREQYRLRVFENRVLRRIFGPRRDDVTG
jgi:hypothetical protein